MTMEFQASSLRITEKDAAIIIKEDGTLEVSLPEVTTETVPENVFTGAALLYALSNPELSQMIYTKFAEVCAGAPQAASPSVR